MGELIQLDKTFLRSAEEFLDHVQKCKITHGAMIYRLDDGSLNWKTFGHEHKTYLVGLLERLKHRLLTKADEEGIWEE